MRGARCDAVSGVHLWLKRARFARHIWQACCATLATPVMYARPPCFHAVPSCASAEASSNTYCYGCGDDGTRHACVVEGMRCQVSPRLHAFCGMLAITAESAVWWPAARAHGFQRYTVPQVNCCDISLQSAAGMVELCAGMPQHAGTRDDGCYDVSTVSSWHLC